MTEIVVSDTTMTEQTVASTTMTEQSEYTEAS